MPKKTKQTNAAQSQATIKTLVKVATEQFAQRGYAAVSTTEVVELAGVTRGALYHHFAGKQGLFLAVYEQAQQNIATEIDAAVREITDTWEAFVVGCRAFLVASANPHYQQIVVIDAPAVLDWDAWRRVETTEGNSLALLREGLHELMEAGIIKPLPLDALTYLLSGAMNEAAVWLAQAEDTEQALSEAEQTLETLLQSLRC